METREIPMNSSMRLVKCFSIESYGSSHDDVIRLLNYSVFSCSDEFLVHLASELLREQPHRMRQIPEDLFRLLPLHGH